MNLRTLFTRAVPRALVLVWLVGVAAPRSDAAQRSSWILDPAHTTISFSIDATGFPRTDGVFHQFDGKISLDLNHPAKSRVGFRVEARSVDVGSDLLADLMRGKTFLDTDHFAGITFESRAVEKLDDHTVRVTGELSLIGLTRPLAVDVEVRRLAEKPRVRYSFTAKAHIDRLAFGMREGFPVISRTIDLVVTSEAVQR